MECVAAGNMSAVERNQQPLPGVRALRTHSDNCILAIHTGPLEYEAMAILGRTRV
jgi:hypothetical protein